MHGQRSDLITAKPCSQIVAYLYRSIIFSALVKRVSDTDSKTPSTETEEKVIHRWLLLIDVVIASLHCLELSRNLGFNSVVVVVVVVVVVIVVDVVVEMAELLLVFVIAVVVMVAVVVAMVMESS